MALLWLICVASFACRLSLVFLLIDRVQIWFFCFFFFNDTATTEIYTLSLHDALPIYHAAFLGTINPDTNKIPKHLFQGYLNIYNNYFKAPWMPDRTEANPNELNQDDARYGFRCCHLKNI